MPKEFLLSVFIFLTFLLKRLFSRQRISCQHYNLNSMLSHLYNRKPVHKPQPQKGNQEADIINSFYQQRKSRSFSAKQHNLLKKNISYFHQQADQQNSLQTSNHIQNHQKVAALNVLRRPPLDLKQSNHQQQSMNQQLKKGRNTPSLHELPTSQYQSEKSYSRYSQSNPLKSQLTDSQYRQHLKNQLQKRININTYLSQLNPNQKHSEVNLKRKHLYEDSQNKSHKNVHKNKSFEKLSLHQDQIEAKPADFYFSEQSQIPKQKQRFNANESLQKKRKIINQSKNSRKSESEQLNKCYQLSKNEFTDRTQAIRHTFGSQKSQKHRRSLLSNQSANKSAHQSSIKSEKQEHLNRLNSQQLTELQYNSHPLRQKTNQIGISQPLRLKYNYFDPQQQAHYKRRIKDLQNELGQLKAKHRRQQKFIQSIAKMKRTIEGSEKEDEYSLKQLWRWIKQLPAKHY